LYDNFTGTDMPCTKPKLHICARWMHICARWRLQILQLQKEKQQTTLPDKPDQLKTRIEYTDETIKGCQPFEGWQP